MLITNSKSVTLYTNYISVHFVFYLFYSFNHMNVIRRVASCVCSVVAGTLVSG